jgi:hypothetical protein
MSSKNRVIKSDRQPKDVESFVLPTEEEYVHSLAVEGLQNKKGAHLKGRPRPGGIKGADSGASRELSEEAERIVSEARMQRRGARRKVPRSLRLLRGSSAASRNWPGCASTASRITSWKSSSSL